MSLTDPSASEKPISDAGSGRRLQVLDGWRAASILLVLACHLIPLGPARWRFNECAGPMGMALFFTLSGFLITTTLARNPNIPSFLIRRGARILPLSTVAIFIYLALQRKGADYYFYHLTYTLNYHYKYFTELTSPFWSLCVEIHFYLAAVMIVGLFGRRGLLGLPLLGLGITALRIYSRVPIATESHLRMDEILAGATLGLLWLDHAGMVGRRCVAALKHVPPPVFAVGLILSSHPFGGPLQYLRPYVAASLVGSTLFAPARYFNLLASAPLRYIAEISYALYVIHPITRFGWFGTGGTIVKYLKRPIGLALVFGLAHLSTFHFESRWIAWGKRMCRRFEEPRERRGGRPSNTSSPSAHRRTDHVEPLAIA